jgi:amidase
LATTVHDKSVRRAGDVFPLPEIDLSRLRVAITPDFGFAPTERGVRAAFASVADRLRPMFARADDATPDCAGADEAFAVLRATGFLAGHEEKVRLHPDRVGPNVRANVEEGLGYSALDVARAGVTQTAIYRRWQQFYSNYDIILSPAITISPRPWTELYPREIDGVATRTYFHWLALAYAVTLPGHPALSLPVGRDAAGMPFGLQIVGPRGGDAFVLAVAAALERALAGDPATARPVPDIVSLRAAASINQMPNFIGFS